MLGLLGFGFGSIIPTVFDQVSRQVPRSQTVQAMTLVTSMLFFDQFFSPILLDGVGMLFGNESIRFTYQFVGSAILSVSICFYFFSIKARKRVLPLSS